MMWHDDHIQSVTTVITAITHEEFVDRYRTTGTVVQQLGWKVLDVGSEGRKRETKGRDEEKTPEQILPVNLATGQLQDIANIEAKKKKTKPPKRFTEGTLLTAMQTAGQSLDEKELSEAMKETGLGTPATRAATIEVLCAIEAWLYRSLGKESGGNRKGDPSYRSGSSRSQESRDDRPMGGLSQEDPTR
jgi:DNA topoisomerase-3